MKSVPLTFVALFSLGCVDVQKIESPSGIEFDDTAGAVEFEVRSARLVDSVQLPDEDFPSLQPGRKVLTIWSVRAEWWGGLDGPAEFNLGLLDRWGALFGEANDEASVAVAGKRLLGREGGSVEVSMPKLDTCTEQDGCDREDRLFSIADFSQYSQSMDFMLIGERAESFGTVNAVYSSETTSCSQFAELNGEQIRHMFATSESFATCDTRDAFIKAHGRE